jgi:hypothetical protein
MGNLLSCKSSVQARRQVSIIWEYKLEDWRSFESNDALIIETAYQKKKTNVTISNGEQVNLKTKTIKNGTNTQVRRIIQIDETFSSRFYSIQ